MAKIKILRSYHGGFLLPNSYSMIVSATLLFGFLQIQFQPSDSLRVSRKCPYGDFYTDDCVSCWCDKGTGRVKCENMITCPRKAVKCPMGRKYVDECESECTCYESTGAIFCKEKANCNSIRRRNAFEPDYIPPPPRHPPDEDNFRIPESVHLPKEELLIEPALIIRRKPSSTSLNSHINSQLGIGEKGNYIEEFLPFGAALGDTFTSSRTNSHKRQPTMLFLYEKQSKNYNEFRNFYKHYLNNRDENHSLGKVSQALSPPNDRKDERIYIKDLMSTATEATKSFFHKPILSVTATLRAPTLSLEGSHLSKLIGSQISKPSNRLDNNLNSDLITELPPVINKPQGVEYERYLPITKKSTSKPIVLPQSIISPRPAGILVPAFPPPQNPLKIIVNVNHKSDGSNNNGKDKVQDRTFVWDEFQQSQSSSNSYRTNRTTPISNPIFGSFDVNKKRFNNNPHTPMPFYNNSRPSPHDTRRPQGILVQQPHPFNTNADHYYDNNRRHYQSNTVVTPIRSDRPVFPGQSPIYRNYNMRTDLRKSQQHEVLSYLPSIHRMPNFADNSHFKGYRPLGPGTQRVIHRQYVPPRNGDQVVQKAAQIWPKGLQISSTQNPFEMAKTTGYSSPVLSKLTKEYTKSYNPPGKSYSPQHQSNDDNLSKTVPNQSLRPNLDEIYSNSYPNSSPKLHNKLHNNHEDPFKLDDSSYVKSYSTPKPSYMSPQFLPTHSSKHHLRPYSSTTPDPYPPYHKWSTTTEASPRYEQSPSAPVAASTPRPYRSSTPRPSYFPTSTGPPSFRGNNWVRVKQSSSEEQYTYYPTEKPHPPPNLYRRPIPQLRDRDFGTTTVLAELDKPVFINHLLPNQMYQQQPPSYRMYINSGDNHMQSSNSYPMPKKRPGLYWHKKFIPKKPKHFRLILKGSQRRPEFYSEKNGVPQFVEKIAREFFPKPEIYVPKIRPEDGQPYLERVVFNHKEIIPKELILQPGGSPMKVRFSPEAEKQMEREWNEATKDGSGYPGQPMQGYQDQQPYSDDNNYNQPMNQPSMSNGMSHNSHYSTTTAPMSSYHENAQSGSIDYDHPPNDFPLTPNSGYQDENMPPSPPSEGPHYSEMLPHTPPQADYPSEQQPPSSGIDFEMNFGLTSSSNGSPHVYSDIPPNNDYSDPISINQHQSDTQLNLGDNLGMIPYFPQVSSTPSPPYDDPFGSNSDGKSPQEHLQSIIFESIVKSLDLTNANKNNQQMTSLIHKTGQPAAPLSAVMQPQPTTVPTSVPKMPPVYPLPPPPEASGSPMQSFTITTLGSDSSEINHDEIIRQIMEMDPEIGPDAEILKNPPDFGETNEQTQHSFMDRSLELEPQTGAVPPAKASTDSIKIQPSNGARLQIPHINLKADSGIITFDFNSGAAEPLPASTPPPETLESGSTPTTESPFEKFIREMFQPATPDATVETDGVAKIFKYDLQKADQVLSFSTSKNKEAEQSTDGGRTLDKRGEKISQADATTTVRTIESTTVKVKSTTSSDELDYYSEEEEEQQKEKVKTSSKRGTTTERTGVIKLDKDNKSRNSSSSSSSKNNDRNSSSTGSKKGKDADESEDAANGTDDPSSSFKNELNWKSKLMGNICDVSPNSALCFTYKSLSMLMSDE